MCITEHMNLELKWKVRYINFPTDGISLNKNLGYDFDIEVRTATNE